MILYRKTNKTSIFCVQLTSKSIQIINEINKIWEIEISHAYAR